MMHAGDTLLNLRSVTGPNMSITPGLAALIHPRAPAEFFASFAADQPFVVHGLDESVRALTQLPVLASLEALLGAWPNSVQVHLPDVADEASAIEATPADARKLFACGMGLLFNDIHATSPVLAGWLAAIAGDLGLSALTQGRCLVYATPAGKGTAPHFDQNVNFVLQLHGTKEWWLAPNHQVERPMTRHTIGLPMDPELATYAQAPMPARMPADGQSIVLTAGSLLFVPRGVWHCTHAESDALSLNFTYSAPTWIDLLMAALRSRLAQSSEWRATAFPGAAPEFAALLRELAEDAPHWSAADILAATEGEEEEVDEVDEDEPSR
jgi:50S ribosomal protein L16 3-hydroxylase